MKEMKSMLTNIDFKEDPVEIKQYMDQRLEKDNWGSIFQVPENNHVIPIDFIKIGNLPSTTLYVERSFRMLNSMLNDKRNYNSNNIEPYFMSYYNSKNL